MRRKTNEEFLAEMAIKHPTLTPLEEYKNGRTKIKIRCNVCGDVFTPQPLSLYMGHGCAACKGTKKLSQEEFIERIFKINPSIKVLGKYESTETPIEVECVNCHHIWNPRPHSLLSGKGCPNCSGLIKKTTASFIEEMKKINSEIEIIGEYVNNCTTIDWYCKKCNKYSSSTPKSLLKNGGCSHGVKSRGEELIQFYLTDHNIEFLREYTFSDCRDQMALPFDFFIPSLNTLIEFDGKQHYMPVSNFGGEEAHQKTKEHDGIKNEYCKSQNIKLIRIPYWDIENIDKILDLELEK